MSYLSALEARLLKLSAIQIHIYFTFLYFCLQISRAPAAAAAAADDDDDDAGAKDKISDTISQPSNSRPFAPDTQNFPSAGDDPGKTPTSAEQTLQPFGSK